jgi:hypothetical protein
MSPPQREVENASSIQSQDLEHSPDARTPPTKDVTAAHTRTAKRRYERIAEAAYRRAERRGFASGAEVDDWLAAEREYDAADALNEWPAPGSSVEHDLRAHTDLSRRR